MSHLPFTEALDIVQERLGDQLDRPVSEHQGWHFGEKIRVIEDDEDEGICAGDEGLLILEVVGSARYHNERVGAGILMEGYDTYMEVDLDNIDSVS